MSSECKLVEVTYSYVYPYRRVAAKERVSVSDTKNTRWFRTVGHEGFCGLIRASATTVRIKGVFVHPEYRGCGVGAAMTEALMAIAATSKQKMEVLAYNPAFYEDRGFVRRNQLHNGAWRLTRDADTV